MVLPMATGKSALELTNFSLANMLFIDTTLGCWFGTSIPIVPLPGIGAIIRIPSAAKLKAISSSKFLIFEIRIPGAGTIS